MTSCNINQDIIPLTLQGTVDATKKITCYVGSKDNPGSMCLNGIYDIYCDFFSYTLSTDEFQFSIGSIFEIQIDELNCNTYNNSISTDGLLQCPTKLLIPIISSNNTSGTNHRNTINTDTIYITSILPKKISKLTLTFDIINIADSVDLTGATDKFILKLILKKSQNNANMSLLSKQHKKKTILNGY